MRHVQTLSLQTFVLFVLFTFLNFFVANLAFFVFFGFFSFLYFFILYFCIFVFFVLLYFCTLSFGWTVHMNFHAKSGVWIVDNSLRVQVQYALVVLPPINRKEIYPQNQTPLKILPPIITQKENFQKLQVTILQKKRTPSWIQEQRKRSHWKAESTQTSTKTEKKFPINWLHSEWPRAWCRFGQRNNIPKNNKSQQCRLWRLWWQIIW